MYSVYSKWDNIDWHHFSHELVALFVSLLISLPLPYRQDIKANCISISPALLGDAAALAIATTMC